MLASRTLAVLLTVWALSDISYLPERVNSFLHDLHRAPASSSSIGYWRHYSLIGRGFLVTRIVGYSLMARWLYKGGPEVEEPFLPAAAQENAVPN